MATRRHFLSLGGAAIAAALGACSTTDPLGTGSANGTGLVVGSQQYYSNEIIAEIYAHALEQAGFAVTRQFQIGQREVYLPELRAGRVDVFPDYSGNLLQSLDASSTATTSAEVEAALAKALPAGLRALRAAPASDQDSYNVTRQSAERYQLVSLADLTRAPQPVRIGGNAELATRPYGPRGLTSHYGIETHLVAVEDSGGPLTRKALAEFRIRHPDRPEVDDPAAECGADRVPPSEPGRRRGAGESAGQARHPRPEGTERPIQTAAAQGLRHRPGLAVQHHLKNDAADQRQSVQKKTAASGAGIAGLR